MRSSHSELYRTSRRSSDRIRPELFEQALGERRDHVLVESRPGLRLPGRIAHPRGEVADDQDRDVAGVLELPQLVEHDGPAERHVGGRGIESELHAQGPSEREFVLEPALGNDLGGPVSQQGEGVGSHGDRMLPVRSGATGRLAHVRKSPGLALVPSSCSRPSRLRAAASPAVRLPQTARARWRRPRSCTRPTAASSPSSTPASTASSSRGRRCRRRSSDAVVAIEDKRFYYHHGVDLRAIIRAAYIDVAVRPDRRGRLDDHAAAREEALRRRRARRSSARSTRRSLRVAARGPAHEGPDPHEVPEHGVLRAGRVRHPSGGSLVLRDRREGPHARRSPHCSPA